MRVLVVDDEIKNAELTALELRDAGHDVRFVNGSHPALKQLESAAFDAVVTDLRMPPPDGLALLQEVKRRWPATRVVLMTAYATIDTARRALKEGAYDCVDKEARILDRLGRESHLQSENRRLEFTRVGGNQPVRVDVRIVGATNRNLEEMVREKQFREDLFFRLNVFPITLPPLRERSGDIERLAGYFLARQGASIEKLTTEALRELQRYPFPGNVRELEYTLERALILAGADLVRPEHLTFARPELMGGGASWVPRIPAEGLSLEVLERELILQALEPARGNKSQAARLLGLTRRTLYSRMEKHGLRKPGEGDEAADEREDSAVVDPHGDGA